MSEGSREPDHCLAQNRITRKEIFLIGVLTIVGGQYSGWNTAYGSGMGVSGIILCILASGYFAMTLCLAEMSSALPFSGGIYGLARAFLHPLLGFVVAVLELLMNIFYISPAVYELALCFVDAGLMSRDYILVVCFCTYLFMSLICVLGGKILWSTVLGVGVTLLLFVMIYQFGSLPVVDFNTWGATNPPVKVTSILNYIPQMAPVFLGIQFLPLTSRGSQKPKRDIPLMMMAVLTVSIVVSVGFLIIPCSQSPGIIALADESYPLRFGYSQIFNISEKAATMMSVPYMFGTIFGFLYFCTHQMTMMAKSKLLPSFFEVETPIYGTPYVSISCLSVVCFLLNVIAFGMNDAEILIGGFFLTSSLASFFVYITALLAYIIFHQKYSSLERGFSSPLQVPGAVFGIVIFLLCLVGGGVFQQAGYLPIVTIIAVAIGAIIYSFFFGGKIVFSEEEKEEMFKAYLITANRATKQRLKRAGKGRLRNNKVTYDASSMTTGKSKGGVGDDSEALGRSKQSNFVENDLEAGNCSSTVTREVQNIISPASLPVPLNTNLNSEGIAVSETPSPTQASSRDDALQVNKTQSLSEKIIQYFSSKFNQILPDPIIPDDYGSDEDDNNGFHAEINDPGNIDDQNDAVMLQQPEMV